MRLPRVPPARPARSRLLAPSQQVALFLLQAVSIGMGICVGQARKKYGVTYPALYAVPGTKSDYSPVTEDTALLKEEKEKKEAVVSDQTAYEFNCIQRGHQNFLEQVQTGGLERPLPFILHGRRAGCAPTLPSIACSVTLRPGARSCERPGHVLHPAGGAQLVHLPAARRRLRRPVDAAQDWVFCRLRVFRYVRAKNYVYIFSVR